MGRRREGRGAFFWAVIAFAIIAGCSDVLGFSHGAQGCPEGLDCGAEQSAGGGGVDGEAAEKGRATSEAGSAANGGSDGDGGGRGGVGSGGDAGGGIGGIGGDGGIGGVVDCQHAFLTCSVTYFKASNTDAGDLFGFGVATFRDTLAIAARLEDGGSTSINGSQNDNTKVDAGAAYVFTRSGDAWMQQAYIKPTNAASYDRFGTAIALDADTLAIGASDALGTGAAYVFFREDSLWTQQAIVRATNLGADDFGGRLDVQGDTLVVGAYFEDSSSTGVDGDELDENAGNSGAAYVFTRSGSIWTQQSYLKASNTEHGDGFGYAVALDGDTLAVGARYEDGGIAGVDGDDADNSMADAGAVYVFVRDGASWVQQAYVKPSNPGEGDHFGSSIALEGDTLVVGARFEDSSATDPQAPDESVVDSGAVYVFKRSGTVWAQEARLKASNPKALDKFGTGLAIRGDLLAVGAHGEASSNSFLDGDQENRVDDSAPSSGAVLLFTRSGATWSQRAFVKAPNAGTGDLFGYAVDLASDGLVVGAYAESSAAKGINGDSTDDSASSSGAVYHFTFQPGSP